MSAQAVIFLPNFLLVRNGFPHLTQLFFVEIRVEEESGE